MANLTPTASWEDILRLELTTRATGGPGGVMNAQAQSLLNRTEFLKNRMDGFDGGGSGALQRSVMANGVTGNGSTVRNTALAGPVTGTGLPAAIAYVSSGSYTIGSNTVSLYISFAAGYDAKGQLDYMGVISTQTTISSIPAGSGTTYVFMERNASTGALSNGQHTGAYSVQWIAPTSPASADLWFDLASMTMKRYNGSAWVVVQVVVLGEYQRGGGIIASGFTCYEYRNPLEYFTGTPVGTIIAKGSTKTPNGFLYCNGQAVSRTVYARLFADLGTTFGTGDGSTTFNLPDLRGEFLRGFDDGRGVDTSAISLVCNTTNASNSVTVQEGTSGLFVGMAVTGTGIPANTTITAISSRTVITLSNNATATGTGVTLSFSATRTIGSSEADMIKRHEHFAAAQANTLNSTSPTTQTTIDWDGATFAQRYNYNGEYFGGAETRPRNIAVAYFIKF